MINNKFRLQSNVYDRTPASNQIQPKKIYFLAVEGNKAEVSYFRGISRNSEELGINSLVKIEVLNRSNKDNNSDPTKVIDLLEEYLRLRNENEYERINELKEQLPADLLNQYNDKFIENYIKQPDLLSNSDKQKFSLELLKLGLDINYREYLTKYHTDYDEFGIIVDKDKRSHSENMLQECYNYCKEKNYNFYITNPCFEFWLLLHLVDVKNKYKKELPLILDNEKVSKHHTYVSNLLSEITHIGKNNIKFEALYLKNVNKAIERVKEFETNEKELIKDNLGSNLGTLIEKMRS